MIFGNTTLQNRSKQERLSQERRIPSHHADGPAVVAYLRTLDGMDDTPVPQLLYSVGLNLLAGRRSVAIEAFLASCDLQPIHVPTAPQGRFDLLGSAYQYLTPKAESLQKGAFYTGRATAAILISGLSFDSDQRILDPSCGSGSLLFASGAGPEQLVGVDNDPVAIMIARFNYFLKFPDAGPPALHCANFFEWYKANREARFDYVVGNPPFGGELDRRLARSAYIRSGESFSHFVELGHRVLKSDGVLRYIVPEALLNVTRHTDVRDYLLDEANLTRVSRHTEKFAGVMSDICSIEVNGGSSSQIVFSGQSEVSVTKDFLRAISNRVLAPWTQSEIAVVEKVRALGAHTLEGSIFGLGVVTGDNKTKLLNHCATGAQPIYTGKEVVKYRLLEPRHFLVFDRDQLQQVAPDFVYRASEKLVYKAICKDLRFAMDDSAALTTNSANILIPKVPGYDVASVMAVLNSDLYSFLHHKLFGGVNKIAKSSLLGLPFPAISFDQNAVLSQLAREASEGGNDEVLQSYVHEELLGLSGSEIEQIRESLKAR